MLAEMQQINGKIAYLNGNKSACWQSSPKSIVVFTEKIRP